jgi:hypothetical protein
LLSSLSQKGNSLVGVNGITSREWAYAGLTFNLIFAALSHTVVDGNPGFIALPLVVLGILALSYYSALQIRQAAAH